MFGSIRFLSRFCVRFVTVEVPEPSLYLPRRKEYRSNNVSESNRGSVEVKLIQANMTRIYWISFASFLEDLGLFWTRGPLEVGAT